MDRIVQDQSNRGRIMRNHKHATWTPYCRTIAQGNGAAATDARICLQIDGTSALSSQRKIEKAVHAHKIDGETFRIRMDAIERIEHMRLAGIQTHVVDTPPDDWEECGGGHRRKDHIGSVKEDR